MIFDRIKGMYPKTIKLDENTRYFDFESFQRFTNFQSLIKTSQNTETLNTAKKYQISGLRKFKKFVVEISTHNML